MRGTVEFTSTGSDMDQVMKNALNRWKKITGDSEAVLPNDSEFHVNESDDVTTLVAKITVRTKIEN